MRSIAVSAAAIAAVLSLAACGKHAGVIDPVIHDEGATATLLPLTRLRTEPYSLTYDSGITDSA